MVTWNMDMDMDIDMDMVEVQGGRTCVAAYGFSYGFLKRVQP